MVYQIGDKVIAYIPEIETYAKGTIFAEYNSSHSYVNFGNLYFALLPNMYDNKGCIPHKNLQHYILESV